MPEELALREIRCDGPAVEYDERTMATWAQRVNTVRQYVFSGSGFTDEREGHVRDCQSIQRIEYCPHGSRGGNQIAEPGQAATVARADANGRARHVLGHIRDSLPRASDRANLHVRGLYAGVHPANVTFPSTSREEMRRPRRVPTSGRARLVTCTRMPRHCHEAPASLCVGFPRRMAEPMHNDDLFNALAESEPVLRDPDDPATRSVDADGAFDDRDVELDDEEEEIRHARASGRREARASRGPLGPMSQRTTHHSHALAERAVLRVGDVAGGKYRVDRVIGRRGSGILAEATHVELGQPVTVRHPPREVRARPNVVARFLRQARAACQIQSEHAARILDAGRLDSGVPFMVMEGLKGWDLDEVLRVRGPLPVEDAVDYLVQACEAVAEAHGMGLVHRSIGTSSLMLTRRPDGSALVKVLDFGVPDVLQSIPFAELAGDAESSAFLGALRFLSPEQIRSPDDVDLRADVWALGAVLHELLTGGAAFFGASPGALMAAIAADAPSVTGAVLRGVPPEIESVILRCLSKDRYARFQTVADFVLALRGFAPADSVRTVERISRMSLPSRPPPLPGAPSSVAAVAVPRVAAAAKTGDKAMPPWLAAAGVVGALVGASLAFGTDRLHAARPEPAAAAEKPLAVEPAAKAAPTPPAAVAQPAPVASTVAKPAAPVTQPQLATQSRSHARVPVATPTPAVTSTAERAKETVVKSAAPVAASSGKSASPAPSAQAARDLFDDTR